MMPFARNSDDGGPRLEHDPSGTTARRDAPSSGQGEVAGEAVDFFRGPLSRFGCGFRQSRWIRRFPTRWRPGIPLDPRRLKALFGAALDLESPADRAVFLGEECGDDGKLRARIDQLLFVLDQPGTALAAPFLAAPFLADFALGETVAVPSGPTAVQDEPRVEPKGGPRPID